MHYRGVTDCHVASLLAMTVGEMSPHPSALPLLTPGMFLRTLRAKRSCTRAHVLPSACHCEPVRTLVWQSVFPAEKPGKLALLQANPQHLSYSPEVLLSVAPCRRVTDCHVAPLLAMTCCNMHLPAWQGRFPSGKFVALFRIPQASPPLQPRTRPSFCMSLRTSAHTGVAIRVSAGKPDKLAAARANSYQLRICLRYYSLPCAAARRTDCHVASLLAMTC